MVKYHNSCYRSCAHRQSLLCLQLREVEAYGSTQWKMTHLSRLCVKTADNCDKSYWKLSFDTQIQVPFTITESQSSSIKLPTVDYGSGSSRNRKLRQWRRQRQGKRHLKINICQVVTILRLPHLARVPQCWRSSRKLDWYTRRKVSGPLRNSALETSATQPVRLSKSKTQRLSS